MVDFEQIFALKHEDYEQLPSGADRKDFYEFPSSEPVYPAIDQYEPEYVQH